MKVLMFGWEFPPHNSGGLGVACMRLSQALDQHGINLTFVLPRSMPVDKHSFRIIFADETPFSIETISSLMGAYMTDREYARRRSKSAHTKGSLGSSLFDEVMHYSMHAEAIATQEQFDVIHAHDWLSFPAAVRAKRASGKPLVAHVHATEFDRTGGGNINTSVYHIEKEGLGEADRVISVSQYTKNILIEKYGIDARKIDVVHNGVAVQYELARPTQHNLRVLKEHSYKIVLFLGRITIQKGPDYFLKAAQKVLAHNPRVLFIIAGSGDMERQVIEEASALGVAGNVIFTGFLRGEEARAVYRAADLYVMPSVSEPFGLTPLEALHEGTPVLISKQSGVSEILTHALKVDFWDTEEMANKILGVVTHSSLYETLRENGHAESRQHTWEKAAEKCAAIYGLLLTAAMG